MQHKNADIYIMIEKYINDFYMQNRYIPVNYQIAESLSLSNATVSRYINQMKKDGKLAVDKFGNITTDRILKISNANIEVPIVGSINNRTTIISDENIKTYIYLSKDALDDASYFMFMAKGNSMKYEGIEDGDFVLVKKQEFANNGNIVLILVNGKVLLRKIYFENNGRIRLHSENSKLKDRYIDKYKIQGVALKVIKNLL